MPESSRDSYAEFIDRKSQSGSMSGFEPLWVPDFLFDFQRTLVEWAIRKGRAAIFADCGLGKTPMQLVWAENVVRKTNGRVLILTPLAVSHQTCREAEKFGLKCIRSVNGRETDRIVTCNYERLHYLDPAGISGVVCDESSILKHFNGKRRQQITEFLRTIKYRLLCTATAAPNDYWELGTSSEALGYLGFRDMITMFFKQDTKKDYLGWGRTQYVFRGHAEQPFWRWVCSWARACRKPSDLGFDDDGFTLPPLVEREHIVTNSTPRPGYLFAVPARDLSEQRMERRITLKERCMVAADIANRHDGATVVWCHLNPEGDLLEKMIDGGVQVAGCMSDEQKEERLLGFQSGQIKRLVIKPKIGAWGLNWPHCHNVVCFPTHSWEAWYQSVRRCWRFGQISPVTATVVATEGEVGVLTNLQRKAAQAERMFASLVRYMSAATNVDRAGYGNLAEQVPEWLKQRGG